MSPEAPGLIQKVRNKIEENRQVAQLLEWAYKSCIDLTQIYPDFITGYFGTSDVRELNVKVADPGQTPVEVTIKYRGAKPGEGNISIEIQGWMEVLCLKTPSVGTDLLEGIVLCDNGSTELVSKRQATLQDTKEFSEVIDRVWAECRTLKSADSFPVTSP